MPASRYIVVIGIVVAMGALGIWRAAPAAEEESQSRVDALMRRKLISAQKVLEGLATENFELLERESERLHLYSQEASWQVLQTDDYRRLSNDFRAAAQQVQDSAKRKNLDGASLGYIKLTIACLECHHHVRKVRSGGSDSPVVIER